MTRKIPQDAFERYLAMGVNRSYEELAKEYGCSRRAITKRAAKESWQGRLREIEQRSRDSTDAKLLETREAVKDRHLKILRFMQSRGVELLRSVPIQTPADAIKAIAIGIEKERLILGEPTERTETTIEEIIKRETATLLEVVDDDEETEPTGGEANPSQQAEAV